MQEFDYKIVKDPEIFRQNRLPAHSDHDYGCDGREFRFMMNGSWHFCYSRNYASAVKDFFRSDFDCRAWDTIQVPGHIQMQGYGVPQYVNTQ